MSRRTEIQVGMTVIVALVVLIWGVTWLREFTLGRKVHVWHVRFPETGGLGPSDEVQVNGIRKGSVSAIQLSGDHVVVDLALAAEVQLTRDCRVAIRNVGLMGEKVIAVDLQTTGRAYTDRDTIDGIFEAGMGEVMAQMGGSIGSLAHMVEKLDVTVSRLQASGDIEKTVANFRATSEQLKAAVEENRTLLHETIANLNAVSGTAKELTAERKEQFERTLDSVERSAKNMERLAGQLDSLRVVVQRIASKVDDGEGSLGKLVNDAKMYDDVRTSIASLNALLEDIKKHPRKYINLSIF